MVGRLDRNLRQGHRAEDFCIYLLRSFCAVAPVPQPDDVGFDMVATLLQADGRFWRAGGTFLVQAKAWSVDHLRYDQDQLRWATQLELPLFVARVDLEAGKIALFPMYSIVNALKPGNYQGATVWLGPRRKERTAGTLDVAVDPPALIFDLSTVQRIESLSSIHTTLAEWLRLDAMARATRAIQLTPQLKWAPNELPTVYAYAMQGHPSEVVRDAEAIKPYLKKLSLYFAFPSSITERNRSHAEALLGALKWVAEIAPDSDLKNVIMVTEHALASSGETSGDADHSG